MGDVEDRESSRPRGWWRRGWWRRKSTPAKVETYTRWSFHFFAVIEVAAVGLPLLGAMPLWLAALLLTLVTVHAVTCAVTASRALDWTRGRRGQPVHMLWTLGTVTAVVAATAIGVVERGPGGDDVDTAVGGMFGVVLIFGAGVMALGVRRRRRVFAVVSGFAGGAVLGGFPLGVALPTALATGVAVLLGGGFLAFTSVFSVWLLNAVYELDEARETRARLAVAEERLRFGRDLHDVVGRNLAVIALKSELAVQLAHRGRHEAVDQMTEVQRIAHDTQREVREVVRGYRDADLGVELIGAQGVLRAAGIECEVTGQAAGLPAEVQSALGWVVREATTNVLRHGDAQRCTVAVRRSEDGVVLTVENDGAAGPPGPGGSTRDRPGRGGSAQGRGGSGLAGLRERLAAVDGTLEAGPVREGVFRLVAQVPTGVVS
ncbi:sensor histidine kinase [Streptomyces sp. Act143]|uniref:sensor histidine kinase n=1 Tax=Streptomyces sp. Act143 TaxID=2200760 RepID=UPI000D6827DD|nr:histidine kinase [Streptomyces sp. Act143]PWI16542.1 sensor histidine kinase [Streptomyces sp. Act143]